MKLSLLMFCLTVLSGEPEFRCWTVLNAPGGDYRVCSTITYL